MSGDHKGKIEAMLGLEASNDYYLQMSEGPTLRVYYDVFSNLHYGYVGKSAGISEDRLHKEADCRTLLSGASDVGDTISMQAGMDMYDRYGDKITSEIVHETVSQVVQDMIVAQSDEVLIWSGEEWFQP